jgi:5-methylthioadenosine/S-adenosylhomocysteine deaminase
MSGELLTKSAIVTIGDTILEIGDCFNLEKKYPGARIFDFKETVIMPGFIDCHAHLELTRLHEKSRYENLFKLMERCGEWHKTVSSGEIAESCRLGQWLSIKNGITYTLDWRNKDISENDYYHLNNIIPAFEIIGPNPALADLKFQNALEKVSKIRDLVLSYFVAPHSLYMVSSEIWEQLTKCNIPMTTHIAEDYSELTWLIEGAGNLVEHCRKRSSIAQININADSLLELVEKRRHFKKGSIFVHGVFLTGHDFELLRQNECYLCLCPSSNYGLTGKTADLETVIDKDVKFVLGTDSFDAKYDLLTEARLLLAGCRKKDAKYIAKRLLQSFTVEASKAVGISHLAGTIKRNKKANLVIVKVNKDFDAESLEYDVINYGNVEGAIFNGTLFGRDS